MPPAIDSHPFTGFYKTHHHWLSRWLQRKTGCSQQAADLAQDTFVRILTSNREDQQIENIREPRSYLVTIARRVLIDHIRREHIERAWLDALSQQPEPVTISPEEQLQIVESLCQLDNMLDGLGTKVRQAFLMSRLGGASYAEIARQLSVSVSSVKKYMARATEQCLICLTEDG